MGCSASTSKIEWKPGTPLSAIQSQFKPLDLIVFRGSEYVSDAIALAQKFRFGSGEWTHVGLVITTDLVPIKNGKQGQLYIWESTMSGPLADGVNSIETGKGKLGVQIRSLADVIDKYDASEDSRIGWCELLNNPLVRLQDESDETYNRRQESIRQLLTEFYDLYGDADYDLNICRLCASVCDRSNTKGTCGVETIFGRSKTLFCSELVATIYQLLGLLGAEIDPEKITPEELVGNTNTGSQPLPCPVKLPPVVITREWPTP